MMDLGFFGCADSLSGNRYHPQIISDTIQQKHNKQTTEEDHVTV